MEVILESGASVDLAPRTTKTVIPLVDQLKTETIKERDDDKFIISVMHLKYTDLFINLLRMIKVMYMIIFFEVQGN